MELQEQIKKADEMFPEEKRKEIIHRIAEEIFRYEGIKISKKVISAMIKINRGYFVIPSHLKYAYKDAPLPLPKNQTISALHMVMIQLHLLDVKKGMKILEIGTGSGYNTSILSYLVGEKGKVVTIEYIYDLYNYAKERFNMLGYRNIIPIHGDGKKGYKKFAPYDRIISTACATTIYRSWKEQIKDNGIILTPIYIEGTQKLIKYYNETKETEEIMDVRFVPIL